MSSNGVPIASTGGKAVSRDLVFLSHANPDDNEYTRWLAAQLTLNGYRVWSDVTKLLGGEAFWEEIEDAIRMHTAKFVLILSRSSNRREGVLNEISVAAATAKSQSFSNFILPVRIDDIPYGDLNVQINRLNAIDSSKNWAAALHEILTVLEECGVPKPYEKSGSSQIATWWRTVFNSDSIITGPERVVSNWYPLQLPDTVWIHSTDRRVSIGELGRTIPYAFHRIRGLLVGFDDFSQLSPYLQNSVSITLAEALHGTQNSSLDQQQLRNSIVYIVRKGFEMTMRSLGFGDHEMSNRNHCVFFKPEQTARKLLPVVIEGVPKTIRALAGKMRDAVWHFGLSAHVSLEYTPHIEFGHHVLFSDDGKRIWDSSDRLHRARRSNCRDWWNAEWRDRISAFIALAGALQGQGGRLEIALGACVSARLELTPYTFTLPLGYDDSRVDAAVTIDGGNDDVE